ncbi:MAG: hypothetical protein WD381_04175 [Balneolaceae bacterium]
MKIKLVPREKVKVSRKSVSKYQSLKDALLKLEPGGNALQVKYDNDKDLVSYRNIVYSYNRESEQKIKSSADPIKNILFFYVE